ncbi:hypothetical protein AOZ07_11460 [Glutamicibacter halophytocola]|uniref:hypothetical protein n=1 Tax=Glutamicibacter halophytocola TaxID=1933880 RepID=UPI0006D4B62A|nr:hypothetical protein [Glutamicibacter halophytocola]ALG29535.1 hypothetical protein AOZ07_11460 [Glutamicibacter halophytocola]
MATKEQQGSPELSENTVGHGEAGVGTPIAGEPKATRSSTYPISGRVAVEHLKLIDEAAERREMKRSDLVVAAVLQFIGKGRAGARKVRVDVPDEVRREVRATQESLDRQTTALNRLGHNVLPQLKKLWAGEDVRDAEVIELLTRIDRNLEAMKSEATAVAMDLRTVLERPTW